MKSDSGKIRLFILVVSLLLTMRPDTVTGQVPSGTLRGQVKDPSGAVISGAAVSAAAETAQSRTVKTDGRGMYEIKDLPPGDYTVEVAAKGFAAYKQQNVKVVSGEVQNFDIALEIFVEKQQVVVEEQGTAVEVNPSSNASTLALSEKDLDALSDDPGDLQSELEALAGPAAGPNGGQIDIDGFTGGRLPPKSAIREVRVNQNPFSAANDKLSYGKIQVFTKPGAEQFHGQAFFYVNNSALNSRNPFASAEPDYQSEIFGGGVGGPLSKKASVFFNAERWSMNNASVVSAVVLDSSLNQIPFSQAILTPETETDLNLRVDYQLNTNNTLTFRYQYEQESDNNNGVGQFSLASQAYNLNNTEQTVQIRDTQILSSSTVNETRFQYARERNLRTVLNFQPAISVLGAFSGGGNSLGNLVDYQDHYELQNFTSMARGKHFVKVGGRLRATGQTNQSNTNFNGTFTFASLDAYQITERGLQQSWTPAQIRAAGGGASQFSIIAGQPLADSTLVDAGLYAEDDWRIRPNMTISYGLRFETQNGISDHADFAPRIGFAWGLGRGKNQPKMVLRTGFGIFYDRFKQDLLLEAERLNGLNQQQIIITSPDFYPNVPPLSSIVGGQSLPTIYRIDPKLRSPYTAQTAVGLERQLVTNATMSITYLHSHGAHMLLSRNINAPLPGTFDPSDPSSGVRPYGNVGNIYQYESQGSFNQDQLITNFTIRAGSRLSLFGYYALNYAKGNTAGASTFPSNQYDLAVDYGRTAFDIRHRVTVGGSIALPQGFRWSPFLVATSGQPFNITLGQDLNGDSIFNDRPAFATDLSRPTVVMTRWGAFDTAPIPGQTIIPPNYGTGPAHFTANMRLSKTFTFGKRLEGDPHGRPASKEGDGGGGPGGRGGGGSGSRSAKEKQPYNLTFSVSVRNLFNYVNEATPIGNLNSPLFGLSNALAGGPFSSSSANRRISLRAQFAF